MSFLTFRSQVCRDLHLTLWDAGEKVEDVDTENWLIQQAEFFAQSHPPKRQKGPQGAQPRSKAAKKDVLARKASFANLRCADNALKAVRGVGLAAFSHDGPGSDEPLPSRPLLVWSFDQASTNMSVAMFLLYKVGLRLITIPDVFHRAWNDTMGALKMAHMWHVVTLAAMAFNLPFGPWDGASWFQKLKESAIDFVATSVDGGPLFDAFYTRLCRDRNQAPTGTSEHKRAMLAQLADRRSFLTKGPHVAIRRWFSWFSSATFHDSVWHDRLLAVTALGIKSHTYKGIWDCLALGGSTKKVHVEDGGQ